MTNTLLSDALTNGGHFGYDSCSQTIGPGLLCCELLTNDGRDAELIKDGLLLYESLHGLIGRGGQTGRALLQGECISQRQDLSAVHGGCGGTDGALNVVRGAENVCETVRIGGAGGLL